MRHVIRFVRNGRVVQLSDIRPDLVLLDYLRLVERATGTKAACEEGACGACTVVIGRMRGGRLVYETANACTLMMAQVDGCEIVTIEDIAEDDGTLHPVQEALVDEHATQCGFCIPGMAMSLFALHHATKGPISEDQARAAIEGNLCRCTGYRPIIAAAIRSGAKRTPGRLDRAREETTKLLTGLADAEDLTIGDEDHFVAAPTDLDRAAELVRKHGDAELVGGIAGRRPARADSDRKVVLLSRIPELRRIQDGAAELVLGGAVTLAEAMPTLSAIDPDLGLLLRRIASPQERSVATLGDKLIGGEPTELSTMLIALGAGVTFLRDGKTRRASAEALYRDDGTPDPELGAVLVQIHIPRPKPRSIIRAYGVGRRWDNTQAIVAGAFKLGLDEDGRIKEASLAFSGLSPAPKRSLGAESALIGYGPLDRSVWPTAFAALREDFAGTVGQRSGARYRAETAQALLGKALIEAGGTSDRRTRLYGFREAEHDAAR